MSSDRKGKKDNKDPGASRYGNFINYYQFHPADERICQLPRGVWYSRHPDRKYIAFDVGCNAGNLTFALWSFLKENIPNVDINILGIDLDPVLIERACENYSNLNIDFKCLDFLSVQQRDQVLENYLQQFQRTQFDVVFCFSITMWIHLNYGDEGFVKFLEDICLYTKMVVIEPQPWKCYRNASRRLRRSGEADFSLIKQLKLTGDIGEHIKNIICGDKCKFEKMVITETNNWGRKLLIFQRVS